MRTLLRDRSQLKGPTATVAALAAVSGALSGHLCDAAPTLVAEVTMAKPGVPHAHNHFANVTVGLYPELSRQARLQRIAADLANARRRSEHPAVLAADRAFAAVPAPLLRWGVSLFDPRRGQRRCPATPWCQAFTAYPPIYASAMRRCC